MTLRIALVCHASTEAMRRGAFPADEPLDGPGAAASARLEGKLPPAGRAWTSPALRATQTARSLGLDAVIEPALRDCGFGRWAGRRLDDIEATEPAALAAWLADPAAAPPGGESGTALLDRVGGWLEECRREPGRLMGVTHAAVIRAAIVHALGGRPGMFAHLDVAPLTMTLLTCRAGRWRLRSAGCRL